MLLLRLLSLLIVAALTPVIEQLEAAALDLLDVAKNGRWGVQVVKGGEGWHMEDFINVLGEIMWLIVSTKRPNGKTKNVAHVVSENSE